MTKYIVTKKFYDRFSNMKLFVPGDIHEPHSEERAKQLLAQGFIAAVTNEESEEETPKSEKSKEQKGRGKRDEVKPKGEGGDDGAKADGQRS
jgi:hypothetical protein